MSRNRRNGTSARPDPSAAAGRRRTSERLVALLVVGGVALNFPLISLFKTGGMVAGIPALYLYLFLVWLVLAVGTALALRGGPPGPGGDGGA